jgi:hypothetical protein
MRGSPTLLCCSTLGKPVSIFGSTLGKPVSIFGSTLGKPVLKRASQTFSEFMRLPKAAADIAHARRTGAVLLHGLRFDVRSSRQLAFYRPAGPVIVARHE